MRIENMFFSLFSSLFKVSFSKKMLNSTLSNSLYGYTSNYRVKDILFYNKFNIENIKFIEKQYRGHLINK